MDVGPWREILSSLVLQHMWWMHVWQLLNETKGYRAQSSREHSDRYGGPCETVETPEECCLSSEEATWRKLIIVRSVLPNPASWDSYQGDHLILIEDFFIWISSLFSLYHENSSSCFWTPRALFLNRFIWTSGLWPHMRNALIIVNSLSVSLWISGRKEAEARRADRWLHPKSAKLVQDKLPWSCTWPWLLVMVVTGQQGLLCLKSSIVALETLPHEKWLKESAGVVV